MLIESLIKPTTKPSRTVECFGKAYEFKPLASTPGRFLADITDERAITALLKTGAYREFTDVLPTSTLSTAPAPVATVAPIVAPPPPPAATATADAGTSTATATATAAVTDPAAPAAVHPETTKAAEELLSGAAKTIRVAIAQGPTATLTKEVLVEALRIESAAEKPRSSVAEALKQAIG